MNEPRDEEKESRGDSPPPLSSLTIKQSQKSLGLQLTPTVTTSPATPSRELANEVRSPIKSDVTKTLSPQSEVKKFGPMRSPPKLATLSKPTSHSFLMSAFRNRSARHSIDVKGLPSYLAKKRQSTFGQFLTVLSSADRDDSSTDEPLFEEPIAPTLSLGERVAWVKTSGPEFGLVRWIGRMPQITNDWTVGIEFDNCIGSGDGTVEGRRYFVAKENFAKFLPLSTLTKVDNYAGRPRSGTMLSRMSVQLKPGQLISIQRSPSIVQQHCSLNAPHHVGHDVHQTNYKHCQCPSCNHPCAHLCQTTRPNTRRRWRDPGLAHMCHFSSKPHAKMCCGGEDLPCATRPLTAPGTSWLPPEDHLVSSYKTVPTEPMARRKSVTIYEERNAISAPTSVERKPDSSPLATHERKPDYSPLPTQERERRGSDLSISSLPSSGSPQVYIARGVLTDESDVDTDTERSYSPRVGHSGMAGLRSLVSCFSNNSSSLREKKRIKDKRKHKQKKYKKRSKSTPNDRRHRRGLSSDTSYDCETTHNSQNQTSSLISNMSSPKVRTNASPVEHKSTSMSPKHSATHSPNEDKNTSKPLNSDVILEETEIVERRHRVDDDTISEGLEGQDVCTSSSKSSGHLITTKADIESTQTPRSSSTHSTVSDSQSPLRRKKTSAPPPPPPTSSASPSSLNLSMSSSSLSQTPTHSSTSVSAAKSRSSSKKVPAPTPPNLTRSLSEQKQLNMKNLINAVPSFRSEVDLMGASRKSSPFEDSVERDEIDVHFNAYKHEVPLNQNHTNDRVGTSDASTQVVFGSDSLEEISKVNGCPEKDFKGNTDLPKRTFDAISTFGCDLYKNSMSKSRSHSMPFPKKQNNGEVVVESRNQRLLSTDLNALLSPKHRHHIDVKWRAESLLRGLSEGSVNSTATVIEFISALTDLEEIGQQCDQSSNSLLDISSDTTTDERITVKSMPMKWSYSSGSYDSLNDSLRSSLTNESPLLPNHKSPNITITSNQYECAGARNELYNCPSEQSLSSSSSTLSYASMGSSSSTPTPISQRVHNELSQRFPGKHPTHPFPKPRSKNKVSNSGTVGKLSENGINENMNRNVFLSSGINTLVPDEARVAQIMEQLEVAIAYGQHKRAAVLARELAIRKVNCTLNRSGLSNQTTTSPIIAYLYIEDRLTHRGPIPFQVYPSMSVNILKLKVEKEFSIPSETQKWILGKTLATNLNASLATYGITCSGCPIFLYLLPEEPKHPIPSNDIFDNNLEQLESDLKTETNEENCLNSLNSVLPEEVVKERPTYYELIQLDDIKCVSNSEPFDCPVCFLNIGVGEGIVLRDCLHMFCRYCLLNAIQFNEEVQVKCPFRDDHYSCDSHMQDREVKGLVPLDLYEKYLQKSISSAESKTEMSFHCKTIDCCGWCEFDDSVNVFTCPVCGRENCLNCQAIHERMTCREYQDQIELTVDGSEDAKKTKQFIDEMLERDEALRCPQCQVVLLKKWGCDWVKCSMCGTEICWVTKGFRWGPKGRGDTSGGCRCNVRGIKCHTKCKYCH